MSAVIENERLTELDIDVFAYLRQTREEAGYSLEEIATRMDVRVAFLSMLEEGELSRKLGPGYIRSLVVRYGACLGLDSEDLLEAVGRLLDGANPRELREGRSHTDRRASLRKRPSPPSIESAPLLKDAAPADLPATAVPSLSFEVDSAPATVAPSLSFEIDGPSPGTESLDFSASLRGEQDRASFSRPGGEAGGAVEKDTTPARRVYEARSRGSRPAKGRGVLRTLMAVALLVGMVGVIAVGGLLLGRYLSGAGEATAAGTAATSNAPADQPSGGDTGAEAGTAAGKVAEGQEGAISGQAAGVNGAEGPQSSADAGDRAVASGSSGKSTEPRSITPSAASESTAFALELRTSDEVWLEVTGESGKPEYFAGLKQAGERLAIDAEGPVLVITGRPEAIELQVEGARVEVPQEFRWVVNSEGVTTP